ncbi:MAG: hypothetical protein ACI30I_01325 [Parabacteroides sp.]
MESLQGKNIVILALLLTLLVGSMATVAWLWHENLRYQEKAVALNQQLEEATLAQKEAIITRRVSEQLEEIAYQQKEMSDEQRKEAVHQTQLAEQMRAKAEHERENAVASQQSALIAFAEMEAQKNLAELRQRETEQAKREADTLAYQALAKQMNEQAILIHESLQRGTYVAEKLSYWKELITLLTYSSWKISKQYGGNGYLPMEMLGRYSQLTRSWTYHKGGIRDLRVDSLTVPAFRVLTCSDYGEVVSWMPDSLHNLTPVTLFDDPAFDFRRIQLDSRNGLVYVLSVDGQLLELSRESRRILRTPVKNPVGMALKENSLYIATRETVYEASLSDWQWKPIYHSDTPISLLACEGGDLLIGSTDDTVCRLDDQGIVQRLSPSHLPMQAPVTAVRWNPQKNCLVYGRKNGTLVISCDPKQGESDNRRVSFSASTLSRVLFEEERHLIASSFEGLLLHMEIGQPNSSTVLDRVGCWIYCLEISPDKSLLFYGDQRGVLHQTAYQPDTFAQEIETRLTRNLMPEEWDQYIGNGYKYEKTIIP